MTSKRGKNVELMMHYQGDEDTRSEEIGIADAITETEAQCHLVKEAESHHFLTGEELKPFECPIHKDENDPRCLFYGSIAAFHPVRMSSQRRSSGMPRGGSGSGSDPNLSRFIMAQQRTAPLDEIEPILTVQPLRIRPPSIVLFAGERSGARGSEASGMRSPGVGSGASGHSTGGTIRSPPGRFFTPTNLAAVVASLSGGASGGGGDADAEPELPDGTFTDRRGLRFSPASLVFKNVFEGERRALRFVLQNISTRPIKVSVIGPTSAFFSLGNPDFSGALAPGLCHLDVLTLQQYSCHADSILPDSFTVMVDGHPEIYAIETQFAAPQLDLQPQELDYGTVNLGAPVRVLMLSLRNRGSLVASYAVDVGGRALDLVVRPQRGKVYAGQEVRLRCEIAPAVEGEFVHTVWVRGAGVALCVPVHVRVVRPRLELLYPPAPEPASAPSIFGPEPAGGGGGSSRRASRQSRHTRATRTTRTTTGTTRTTRATRASGDTASAVSAADLPREPATPDADACDRMSFALLDFGAVYFGAEGRLTATVHNASADVCTFVVLAELPGEENVTLSEARARFPRLRAFRTHPDEGRIDSFETRIFTVGFDPKLWLDEEDGRRATTKEDFLLFLRVMRVQCMDFERSDTGGNPGYVDIPQRPRSISEDFGWRETEEEHADPFTTGEASELRRREILAARSSAVRLCLHGEALPVALSVRPNALQLGRVALGATQQRVLRLTNDGARLPLLFRVAHPIPPGVRVHPTEGALQPGGSVEVAACVTPVSFGTCRSRLRLELLSASWPLLAPEERALVGYRVVRIVYECPAELPPPPPRLAPGLTPIINREVGVVGDGVPFCSSVEKPRMAMLRYDLRSRAFKMQRAIKATSEKKSEGPDVARKTLARKAPVGTCHDVPCDPDHMQCCDRCYERPSLSWSSLESSTPSSQATAQEEAEMTAAEVERMLVPQIPRIACGIVMEPVSDTSAARGTDGSTLATCGDGDSDAQRTVDSRVSGGSAATRDSAGVGCIIGNLLDAVAHARDASSFTLSSGDDDYDDDDDDDDMDDDWDDDSAMTTSDVGGIRLMPPAQLLPSEGGGASLDQEPGSLGDASGPVGRPSTSEDRHPPLGPASSEKLLRVTDLNVPRPAQQTAATQTYIVGTTQKSPDELQQNLRKKVKKSGEQGTSRISVDFGAMGASGDHGDGPRSGRPQTSIGTSQNISAFSRMKSLTRPLLLPALESLSAPPPSLETLRPPTAMSKTLHPSRENPQKITEVSAKEKTQSPETTQPPPLEDVLKHLSESVKRSTQKKEHRFAKCCESPDLLKSMMPTISENVTTPPQSATSKTRDSSQWVKSPTQARNMPVPTTINVEGSQKKATRMAQKIDDQSVRPAIRAESKKSARSPKRVSIKTGELFPRSSNVKNREGSWILESRDPTPSSAPFSTCEETSATVTLAPVFHPATTCYLSLENSPRRPKFSEKQTNSDDDDDDSDQLSGSSLPYSIGPAPLNPQSAQLTPLTGRRSLGTAMARTQTPTVAQTLTEEFAPPQPTPEPASYQRCEALRWARGEQLHPHCAFIAFPNDTDQRALRPWPSNRLTRTIFTGAPRYVAPQDLEEAVSPEELLARKAFEDMWRWEFRSQAERLREARDAANPERFALPDYDVADPSLYNFLRFRPCATPLDASSRSLAPQDPDSRTDFLHALVPLTPKQLIHVRLAPPQVDYGTVGVGSRVSTKVRVHNDNALPVKVNIGSPVTCVSVVGDGVVYVRPHDAAELEIVFEPTTLGRFNGMLRYVVNDSHAFEAPVSGSVVLPSLHLRESSVNFGYLRGFEEAFPRVINVVSIHNPLQVPCNFEWMALDRTCYDVVPRKGEVPAMGERACEVTYRASLEAQIADASLLLASESENYLQLSCHLVTPHPIHAGFVHQLQALPDLSLLRRRVFNLYLYNSSYLEELYRVEDPRPGSLCVRGDTFVDMDTNRDRNGAGDNGSKTPGGRILWYVRPARGALRPRSIKRLRLVVRALAPGPVKFQLRIAIGPEAHAPPTSQGDASAAALQTGRPRAQQTLFTDISTFVAYPVVTVRPSELRFRRVPAGSHVAESLWLQNVGTVEATVRVASTEEFSALGGEWAVSTSRDRLAPLRRPLLLKPRSPPVELFLHFCPLDLSSYDFLVPFRINGGIGPPLVDDPKTQRADHYVPGSEDLTGLLPPPKLPCLRVGATVARRLIHLSATEINFFYNPSSPKTWILNQTLEIDNPQRETVYVWIPLKVLRDTPFSIRPNAGATSLGSSRLMAKEVSKALFRSQLAQMTCGLVIKDSVLSCLDDHVSLISKMSEMGPFDEEDDDEAVLAVTLEINESSPFEVKYEPREPGTFAVSIPIFASRRDWMKKPLLQLKLRGTFEGPSLTVSPDEVCLPTRSLNIPAEVRLSLEARNFVQETMIEWKCNEMRSERGDPVPKDCLQVVMFEKRVPPGPEPTTLSFDVVFKSARPLGLLALLELSAAASHPVRCVVRVTAIADNSQLTTYSFLRSRSMPFAPPPPPHARPGASWLCRPFRSSRKSSRPQGRADAQSDSDSAEDDNDGDWPDAEKSRKSASPPQSLGNVSSFLPEAAAEALSEARAVLMEVTDAAVAQFEGERKGSTATVPARADSPASPKSFSRGAVRRHRGSSRCSVATATVDADDDSLLSSESSEDEFQEFAYLSKPPSAKTPSDSISDMDEGFTFMPLFPDKNDLSEYAQHLRRVKQAIEEWTYDVAYRRHYFASLPSGMNECYNLYEGETGRVVEPAKATRKAKPKAEPQSACPFNHNTPLFALRNIAGDDVYDMIRGRKAEDTESNDSSFTSKRDKPNVWELAQAAMRSYALLLTLLRANGAVLPHVRPEDLIDYKRYELLFKETPIWKEADSGASGDSTSNSSDSTPLWTLTGPKSSEKEHRGRSVMAWMDVSLQMAKVFWFPKIDEEHMNTQDDGREWNDSFQTPGGQDDRSRQYHVASAASHSEQELMLLAWLNDRFERARRDLCPRSPKPPRARLVTNFDRDLADSLVLAGVTLDICPFLRDHLPDLYPAPATSEQAQHNAARLISAWRVMHLGFTVSLRDIVYPIAVKMLLLVAFLYSIMPSMAALHTLKMSAPLSTRGSTTVVLVNPGKERLTYLAEFVGDPGSFFSVFTPNGRGAYGADSVGVVFPLAGGQRLNLQVVFHAKTFRKQSSTLLITGNIHAPNFGRAVAFRLEGEPSSLDVSTTLHVSSPLYKPCKRLLSLPLPYDIDPTDSNPTEFDLYLQETEPDASQEFSGRMWAQQRTRKVLRRLFLNQSRMEATPQLPSKAPKRENARGVAPPPPARTSESKRPASPHTFVVELSATVCAFTPRVCDYWIGCVSPTFGDFIVKIVSRPILTGVLDTLTLPLPAEWRTAMCTCGGRLSVYEGMNTELLCPLITHVMIPSRNAALWSAVAIMFEKTLGDSEKRFWKQYLDSNIGLRLMQWVLERGDDPIVKEYEYIFNSSATYRVTINNNTVQGPSEFNIPDVFGDESVPLMLHVDNLTPADLRTRLRLTSSDGLELRNYIVEAQAPPGTPDRLSTPFLSESSRKTTATTTTRVTVPKTPKTKTSQSERTSAGGRK